MGRHDYYSVLGVSPHASTDDIRRAYVALARRVHPDARSSGDGREMQELNAAWWVLRDPIRRAAHDRELGLAPRAPSAPTASRPGAGSAEDAGEVHVPLHAQRPETGPAGRTGDLLLFVPPAFLFGAIACFALGMLMFNGPMLGVGAVLLVLSGVSFVVSPFVALARDRRAIRRGR